MNELKYVFEIFGCIYFFIGTIDYIRWWNGMNDDWSPR